MSAAAHTAPVPAAAASPDRVPEIADHAVHLHSTIPSSTRAIDWQRGRYQSRSWSCQHVRRREFTPPARGLAPKPPSPIRNNHVVFSPQDEATSCSSVTPSCSGLLLYHRPPRAHNSQAAARACHRRPRTAVREHCHLNPSVTLHRKVERNRLSSACCICSPCN